MSTTLSSPSDSNLPKESLAVPDTIPPALHLARARRQRRLGLVFELVVILLVGLLYSRSALLDFNSLNLQQTFEHNEAATLSVLTELGLKRHGVIPLWNPYMQTGFPYAGDFVSSFWNPVATLPIWLFGGVNGYKVATFLSFIVAGLGQWFWGYRLGLRPSLRLWSALLFMVSGGLIVFWHLGWHQLLIGVVWFPAAFATMSWVCQSRSRLPVVLAALTITMILSSAGGYYFLYLPVLLGVLTLTLLVFTPAPQRWTALKRVAAVGLLSIGLLGVVWVPGIDVYRHTLRQSGVDPQQSGSLPIPHALLQYVIADRGWFNSEALGQLAGSSWFYIGALPLAVMVFLPLAFNRSRRRQRALAVCLVLTAFLLAWHANRHTPIGLVYRAFPFLYTFRFPFRLLVIATSPLIMVGAFGLHGLWLALGRISRHHRSAPSLSRLLPQFLLLLLLAHSVWNVLSINRSFAFTIDSRREQQASRAIQWLHERDPGLYYIAAGDWQVWWWWTTYAYELEQPVINFAYNREVKGFAGQQVEGSVIRAQPKYIFPWPERPPANAEFVDNFENLPVYEMPQALPFAFAVSPEQLTWGIPLTAADVQAFEARWANPNQLVVEATASGPEQKLVALVSMFPGWKVAVDGRAAPLTPVNDYLGVTALEGRHTYVFTYAPPLFYIGLALSAVSLLGALALLVAPSVRRKPGA
jgi:hypothetical protein